MNLMKLSLDFIPYLDYYIVLPNLSCLRGTRVALFA